MLDEISFKKLEQYKSELTFDKDKRAITVLEQKIRKAMDDNEIFRMEPIQKIITMISGKIKKANAVLQEDENLSEDDRKKIYLRKDEQKWFLSLLTGNEKILNNAEEFIKKNAS